MLGIIKEMVELASSQTVRDMCDVVSESFGFESLHPMSFWTLEACVTVCLGSNVVSSG